jgi:hypothetical protein
VISNAHLIWIRLCGAMAVALIIFASVMLPTKWEQLRSGHWAIEHFFAYFAAASIICLGWSRPFVLAGVLGGIGGAAARGNTKCRTHSFGQLPFGNEWSWRGHRSCTRCLRCSSNRETEVQKSRGSALIRRMALSFAGRHI